MRWLYSFMDTATPQPKAWVDGGVWFRGDVSMDDARELEAMLRQAYDAGLRSGYQQGQASR